MRKYVIGFIVGAALTWTSAAFAGNTIQAVLFPAKYEINGAARELPEGYHTLEVEGRAYVPIRYIAESLDTVVAYDEAAMTIQVDNGFTVTSLNNGIRAGHLTVSASDQGSIVKGKLFVGQQHWDALIESRKPPVEPGDQVNVGGTLMFYDAEGRYMGKALVQVPFTAKGDQIKTFEATADRDVSGYAFAALAFSHPAPVGLPLPPNISMYDTKKQLGVGDIRTVKQGEFTRILGSVSLNVSGTYKFEATLTFLDAEGRTLGTADVQGSGYGSAEHFTASKFEAAGKGDFTAAANYMITVNKMEKISDTYVDR